MFAKASRRGYLKGWGNGSRELNPLFSDSDATEFTLDPLFGAIMYARTQTIKVVFKRQPTI